MASRSLEDMALPVLQRILFRADPFSGIFLPKEEDLGCFNCETIPYIGTTYGSDL